MADQGTAHSESCPGLNTPLTPPADLVAWTSDLSVHSPTLDAHHRILIGCLNRMICIRDDWQNSLPAIRRELALVMNYCRIHFFIEESAMTRVGLAKSIITAHRRSHRRLVETMKQTIRLFHFNPTAFPFNETLHFMRIWLRQHIHEEDKDDYSNSLRADPSIEDALSQYRYAELSRKLNLRAGLFGRPGGQDLVGRTVALVAEDTDKRETGAAALRAQGLEVTSADSLSDARTLLASGTPELLILDWTLPDAATLAWHLYRTRNTAVIACHTGDPMDIIDDCDIRGVANILTYPCQDAQVETVMRETLDALAPMRALVLERLMLERRATASAG